MENEPQNSPEELPNKTPETQLKEENEGFEVPASITWMKSQYAKFQKLTTKDVSDNVWLIGLKFFLKGIMVLILIIMSPFILFMIVFSLMIAG